MPTSVYWDSPEKTIVKHIYDGLVGGDDFHQVVEASAQLLNSVEHPVDIIVDMTSARLKSNSFLSLVSAVERKVPANQRQLVIVKVPGFIKAMIAVARHVAPKATANLHFVDQLEDAYALIARLNTPQSA